MILGLLFAIAGAALVGAGCTIAPWFTPEQWPEGLFGQHFLVGPYIFGAAGAAVLFALLAIVLRKKLLATGTLLAGLGTLTGLMLSWFLLAKFAPEALTAKPDLLAKITHQKLPLGVGFWYTFAGASLMILGATLQVATVKTWTSTTKFLRVSQIWNGTVVRQYFLNEPRDIEAGSDAHDGLVIPSPKLEKRFHMFRAHRVANSYDIALKPDFVGTFNIGGKRMTAEEVYAMAKPAGGDVKSLRLTGDDSGKIDFGDLSVVFQFVKPGVPGGGLSSLAIETWTSAAATVAVFIVLSFVAYLCYKYDPQFEGYQFAKLDKKSMLVDAEALALIKEEEKKEEEKDEELDEEDPSKAAPDEEGKFGDKDIPDEIESKVPKNEGRMVDKIDPKKVGLVDILSSQKFQQMSAMSNILAANTDSMSSKLAIAMAGSGTEFVMGGGTGGMGFKGTGTGGGGDGGFGRIHGLGKIDGGNGGLGTGVGLGNKGMKKVGKLNVGSGQSAGFCQKDNISSVVRSRANAIRACYESRLQVNANLAGKLTARWTIGVDGRVTAASLTQNTVSDGAVGSCVLDKVRRMTFAKPEGGVCIVQWPFVFNPG